MREISDDAKHNCASWTKVNAEFTDQRASIAAMESNAIEPGLRA